MFKRNQIRWFVFGIKWNTKKREQKSDSFQKRFSNKWRCPSPYSIITSEWNWYNWIRTSEHVCTMSGTMTFYFCVCMCLCGGERERENWNFRFISQRWLTEVTCRNFHSMDCILFAISIWLFELARAFIMFHIVFDNGIVNPVNALTSEIEFESATDSNVCTINFVYDCNNFFFFSALDFPIGSIVGWFLPRHIHGYH